jgi:hypothetical protein
MLLLEAQNFEKIVRNNEGATWDSPKVQCNNSVTTV